MFEFIEELAGNLAVVDVRCAVFIGVAVLIGIVVGLASVGSMTRALAMLVFAHAANLTCSR